MSLKDLKVAIVCDWLTNQGGAEKVILGLHQLFPNAPIYTSLYNPEKVKGFEKAEVHTSFLQKIPFAKNKHQFFLSLMPRAFESFDLDQYDIVISSSHSCAKGIIVKPSTLHVCYCHSPMRYAWENHQNYLKEHPVSSFIKRFASFFIHKIRLWDRLSADRVDQFVANSNYISNRIHKYYRRPSKVIYPFIKPDNFAAGEKKNFYLAVGRLTAYKKFDLIVKTFNLNGLPLKIVGTGPMEKMLRKIAKPNIEFLGFTPDSELKVLYGQAKALIFPQCEDFGIIPLEAMASGCPVIALRKGGALETIKDGETGILFDEQTEQSLQSAIAKFEENPQQFSSEKIIQHAHYFNQNRFNQDFLKLLEETWQEYQLNQLQ
jgi:glycosyltransferase involved in cell wall biosynthesis